MLARERTTVTTRWSSVERRASWSSRNARPTRRRRLRCSPRPSVCSTTLGPMKWQLASRIARDALRADLVVGRAVSCVPARRAGRAGCGPPREVSTLRSNGGRRPNASSGVRSRRMRPRNEPRRSQQPRWPRSKPTSTRRRGRARVSRRRATRWSHRSTRSTAPTASATPRLRPRDAARRALRDATRSREAIADEERVARHGYDTARDEVALLGPPARLGADVSLLDEWRSLVEWAQSESRSRREAASRPDRAGVVHRRSSSGPSR